MDEIDRAQQREELYREDALAASRAGCGGIEINGACHNCGEMTDRLFCCLECRDDWQVRRDAEKRNGGAA